jgi:hypothetical protein
MCDYERRFIRLEERLVHKTAELKDDVARLLLEHGADPTSKDQQGKTAEDPLMLLSTPFALHFGTREFVMYNPRDLQAMTSHKVDLLQLTPQELALEQSRGHYAVHDAPQPHWKYF